MTPQKLTQNKFIVSNHEFALVVQDPDNRQFALLATKPFKQGEVISPFYAGTIQTYATYLTVQVNIGRHITLKPEFLQYINHSCSPTVFFDTTAMQLIALKDLAEGDEFTFFYPSTEWDMAQPFLCNCGNDNCLQLINGATHLSQSTLKKYRLTDFIKQQLKLKKQTV